MSITRDELENWLKAAIQDGKTWSAVKELLGGASMPQTVSGWLSDSRGLPKALLEGAALVLLGKPDFMTGEDQERPPRLPKMRAAEVWHVFYVHDHGGKEASEKADGKRDGARRAQADGRRHCTVWRFWRGLRVEGLESSRFFNHNTWSEGAIDVTTVESIGSVRVECKATEDEPRLLMCQAKVSRTPKDVGFRLLTRNAIQEGKSESRTWEFVGGSNIVPAAKSFLLASVPRKVIHSFRPNWLSFAPQISPIAFLSTAVMQPSMQEAFDETDSTADPFFSPWGDMGSVKISDEIGPLDLPPELAESTRTVTDDKDKSAAAFGWRKLGGTAGRYVAEVAAGRRLLFQQFEDPEPLTYQSIVYRLP